MSEPKETAGKSQSGSAGVGTRKPLTLKRTVDSGHVQQKFSHGRSKTVLVETKRKRALNVPEQEEAPPEPVRPPAPAAKPKADQPAMPATAESARVEVNRTGAAAARDLSDSERTARARALAAAQVVQAEAQRQQVLVAQRAEAAERASAEAAPRQPEVEPAAAAAPVAVAPQAPVEAEESVAAPEAVAASAVKSEPVATVPPVAPVAAPRPAAPAAAAPSAARTPPGQLGTQMTERRLTARTGSAPVGTGQVHLPPRAGATPSTPVTDSSAQPVLRPWAPIRPQIVTRTDRASPRPPEAPKKPEVEKLTRQPRQPAAAALAEIADDDEKRARKKGGAAKVAARPVKGAELRERGKLTINNAFNEQQRERSLASLKRKREREKLKAMGIAQSREKIIREVIIPEAITIQELANRMTERAVDVIKLLMKQGEMHTINDVIDADTAELIVQDFGHIPKRVSEADVEEGFIGEKDEDESLRPRAPVVTIMGHVDHGKTSLLDALRSANVAAGEAGGITQHIGAYQVETPAGGLITFIDTPGHEAFTAMRARGAKVTDIVVLVVAADDGVMPQTVEAINHAKAANVPLIVAINKIDKADADPSRVRTELLQHEIVVESMSGETLEVEVSALKRLNLDKLLEAIALQAEILDLKANPDRSAEGYVIEAKLERGRGPVGTLLVERGTLAVGDILVAGSAWGRVRALIDDKGLNVEAAGPSVPVEVLGFDSAPEAGDQFAVVESEARAREITDYRVRKRREALGSAGTSRTLEQMMQQLKEAGTKEFTLVVKGDVQGSVEAIIGALRKLSTEEVEARIVHSGVGGITESDIALASASKAVILGFNVRANTQAKAAAERDGVEIRYYNIIYDLVDDVKAAMSGLLAPSVREVFIGNAQILQVFNITKVGKVAGCRVTDGKVERGAKVRLIRDNVVIHEGTLSVLKRFKDDAREVVAGQECGMSFANYQDLREGDVIECFQVETVARTL
jgi:translation initiation factor IF-2